MLLDLIWATFRYVSSNNLITPQAYFSQFLFIDLALILPIAIFSQFYASASHISLLTNLQWVGPAHTLPSPANDQPPVLCLARFSHHSSGRLPSACSFKPSASRSSGARSGTKSPSWTRRSPTLQTRRTRPSSSSLATSTFCPPLCLASASPFASPWRIIVRLLLFFYRLLD